MKKSARRSQPHDTKHDHLIHLDDWVRSVRTPENGTVLDDFADATHEMFPDEQYLTATGWAESLEAFRLFADVVMPAVVRGMGW